MHSLRAGGATEAANSGVDDRCWKRNGPWKEDNGKIGYVADSLERRLDVSKSLHVYFTKPLVWYCKVASLLYLNVFFSDRKRLNYYVI